MMMNNFEEYDASEGMEVAIVGMAGRFPGAKNLEEFWQNLRSGVESVTAFTDEEVLAAGADPVLLKDPHYVKSGAVLEDIELFDAGFFGIYPGEAAIMDPQHRFFLETAWEALENAGYNPEIYKGWVGVYGGVGMNTYLVFNLITNPEIVETVHGYQLTISNDKDFLPTRVSYKLNLRGPSINVQTACSTSLVAVHLACQGLLNYQCDMALAGGVAIRLPQRQGYMYQEGGIASPDGHCRPFDENAQGTVSGNGVGIVVLKRMADALADGDTIHAVIKGSAINNDGSLKVGYTAPSVEGQAEVIAMAQTVANVDPASISYIEAHGTGTALGDPIEIAALNQAFQNNSQEKGFCAIGSLKSNIGHLDAAAGVASLIKTTLALEHKELPPSLNFERPNPKIDFENSPFYVNDQLSDWEVDGGPRRAGVSSFGIGGTNAHVVMEEAPPQGPSGPSRLWQLLLLSARSPSALEVASTHLAEYLRGHQDIHLSDAAYTLQVGRKTFEHRQILVCQEREDAIQALETRDPQRLIAGFKENDGASPAFMFTGQGAQYVNMARELYRSEPLFRETVDHCSEMLPELGSDLRKLLYPDSTRTEAAADSLKQTFITQPALFVIEYALATLLMAWGIHPEAMIGHSIGEYVAACLAGVFSLEDALALVAARGRLMQSLPGGSMLSIPLAEETVRPYLSEEISLAAVNAPSLCVVSGPHEAINVLEKRLAQDGVETRRLHTSHAFHSPMMEPILEAFTQRVAQVDLQPPKIPFISNVTGTWISPEQATDPTYWATHLRQAVRFADGIGELLKDPIRVLIEVGPGRTLNTLAKAYSEASRDRLILSTLRHPHDTQSDLAFLLTTLGRLWMAGVQVDWEAFYTGEDRRRVPLPTYPFERQRYWIEPGGKSPLIASRSAAMRKRLDIDDWFYAPSWKRADLPPTFSPERLAARWLVFADDGELSREVIQSLTQYGREVIAIQAGPDFGQISEGQYCLNPHDPQSYAALLDELHRLDLIPGGILHLWSAATLGPDLTGEERFAEAQSLGFYSLLYLAQAMNHIVPEVAVNIGVVTTEAQEVTGDENLTPEKATLFGLCNVIPQEFPQITCWAMDFAGQGALSPARWTDRILAEMAHQPLDGLAAYRGNHRWVQVFEPLKAGSAAQEGQRLRQQGVYLITGGLGRIGLTLSTFLARSLQARLVLVDRFPFPEHDAWEGWLRTHGEGEGTSRKIRQLQEILTQGGEVLLVSAEVSDCGQMQAVVDQAVERFGALNGVIHAAGFVGEASMKPIQDLTPSDCEMHFQAKVHGLRVLASVLEDRALDFCFLQSSLSTILGGLGLGAYAAANYYMDVFAAQRNQIGGTLWVNANWDGWRFGEEAGMGGAMAELAMTPEEGVEAFQRALLLSGTNQIVISTGDLEARLDQWVRRQSQKEKPTSKEASTNQHPRPRLRTEYVAPRSELEESIVNTWEKVLGIQQIGVFDDFFELGGHSLLATQLVSRLRDTYHVELPLRKLFETPNVAGLAALIEAGRADSTPSRDEDSIQPVPRDRDLPLSFGQQRLWFLDQLEPESPLYNNFAAVRFIGPLSAQALEQSLEAIVQRHEILRTTFHAENGKPVQRIASNLGVSMGRLDLTELPEGEHQAEVLRLAMEESRQPFNLAEGPLFRISLLRLNEDDHVVFLTMHHIISDGWSVGVMIRELGALYAAYTSEQPPLYPEMLPLPPLPIQYADYAAWQREWMKGEVLEEQLDYWKRQLGDSTGILDLPTDHPRPAMQTSQGASKWFELPQSLTRQLDALCQQEGVTLFMALLAALQTLLYRYTGQEDLNIGTPIANRNRGELEGLIGFLLNTLVIRGDLSGAPNFRELLQRVREVALEAYAHQDLPFEMLVEELQPQRDMSRAPFFQVIFDLQVAPLQALELPNLTIAPLKVDSGTAKFDLALSMEDIPGEGQKRRLGGFLNYNTDLFAEVTIQRMTSHFENLLQAIVSDPDQPISKLPLLSPAERQDLLIEWNDTATGESPAPLVRRMFEAQVERTPDEVAVIFGKYSLTYRELNARANQLAHYLRELGVGAEQLVGVCVERSMEMVVAVLGIFKSGGAFLPLDPEYPQERLAFMLEDARVSVLLTQESLLEKVAVNQELGTRNQGSGAQIPITQSLIPNYLCLDSDWSLIAQEPTENPDSGIMPDDLAYVIYTSGSTGRPKGVQITQGTFANHIRDVRRHFQVEAGDCLLQFASLNFDPALEQIFETLTVGARLVLRGNEIWPPEEFHRKIAEYGLTIVNVPPAYWHQWAQYAATAGPEIHPEQLKLVIIGGDVMLSETLQIWQRTPMRSVRLLNAYGPTEATITSATFEVPSYFDALSSKRIPIGRPLANRKFYVLDPNGNPTPVGVTGELHIGGAGLARGYLNRPELTAEKFVPNPFLNEEGRRMNAEVNSPSNISHSEFLYRTGDLVRYLPSGDVEFLGRIDTQVKLRGIRIELGEIEAVFSSYPAVREVAVLSRESGQDGHLVGDTRLVAYVVVDPEKAPSASELYAFVKDKLPAYMLPTHILLLEAMPRLISGKVDRKALDSLPLPEQGRSALQAAYLAPRNPVEEDLAAIWAEVLGVERVGIQDNFFELGGHSLLATQIVSRVRKTYQVDLPLRRLFETPTIAELATSIAQSLVEQEGQEDMEQLLAELEGLSEDEIRQLLAGEAQ